MQNFDADAIFCKLPTDTDSAAPTTSAASEILAGIDPAAIQALQALLASQTATAPAPATPPPASAQNFGPPSTQSAVSPQTPQFYAPPQAIQPAVAPQPQPSTPPQRPSRATAPTAPPTGHLDSPGRYFDYYRSRAAGLIHLAIEKGLPESEVQRFDATAFTMGLEALKQWIEYFQYIIRS